jgi:hypothetical protein
MPNDLSVRCFSILSPRDPHMLKSIKPKVDFELG